MRSELWGPADSTTAEGSSPTKYCHECKKTVPRRCRHCPLCKICILRKDHHCFLLGGCAGLANQVFFFLESILLNLNIYLALFHCLSLLGLNWCRLWNFIQHCLFKSLHRALVPIWMDLLYWTGNFNYRVKINKFRLQCFVGLLAWKQLSICFWP